MGPRPAGMAVVGAMTMAAHPAVAAVAVDAVAVAVGVAVAHPLDGRA